MYRCLITSEPSSEPVTLTELKAHLKIGHSLDDTELGDKISEARKALEGRTNRAFFTQTRALYFSKFKHSETRILLPGSPVASISSVVYVDVNGDSQTWTSSEYSLRVGEPSYLQLAYNEDWPDTRSRRDEIAITYVCGASDVADIDVRAKAAIKLHVEMNYDREENRDKTSERIASAYESLVTQLTIGDEFLSYA